MRSRTRTKTKMKRCKGEACTWWLLRDSRQLLADIFIASPSPPPPHRCPSRSDLCVSSRLLSSFPYISQAHPVFTSVHEGSWMNDRSFWKSTILPRVPALLPHIHEHICWSVQCRHLDRPLVSGRGQGWAIPTISPLWEALQSYAACRQSSQCTFPVCFVCLRHDLLIIGCGLSVRWAVSSLGQTTNWTRYTDGSTVTSRWALIKPSPLY